MDCMTVKVKEKKVTNIFSKDRMKLNRLQQKNCHHWIAEEQTEILE